MDISVVVITKNEEKYIKDLLDSLISQVQKPYEIIVVDAGSKDGTQEIVRKYSADHKNVSLYIHPGTRAESRNFGAERASGEAVAFIDADCIANSFWIKEIDKSMHENADTVSGKTIKFGFSGFANLPRVAVYHKGVDITYPSCNLAYKKKIFTSVNGFDPWFKEAEELDLNYRVVDAGGKLHYNKNAIVYHRARESFIGFVKQSFWYGFGRKELTLKHGSLWSKYEPIEMVKVSRKGSLWKFIRLGIAFFGYMFCRFGVGKKVELKEKLRKSKMSARE